MIINKKIKRTMLESRSQYVGSIALIVLSCLMFTMFSLLSINMGSLTSNFEADYRQEDVHFVTDKKLANIEALEKQFHAEIEESMTVDYPVSEDKTLRIFSENTKVNLPAIIKGGALKKGGILIDPSYAKANKLKPGDIIKIYDKGFTLNGFLSLPNYIYPLRTETDILNDPNSFGIAVISKEDFNDLGRGSGSYAVRYLSNELNLNESISQFKAALRMQGIILLNWTNITDNPRVTFVTLKLAGIDQMSTSLPIAVLLLTCILTGIVMWRMLEKESIIIGTLYALGYRKKEILRHYLLYPLILSLTGGLLGTLLGMLTLRPMLAFMVSYFNIPVGSLNFDTSYLVLSVLLPVVFLIVSSVLIIGKSLKRTPVELMRGSKESSKVGWMEKRIRLDRFRFRTKFQIREQLRSMARSAFLLFGIIMATMLLLMGFASKSSIEYLMKDAFNEAFQYKYHYVFNSIRQGKPDAGEAFSELPFTLKTNDKLSFTIYGVSPGSKFISFKDKEGNELKPDKIIITKPLAEKLDVKQGDIIEAVNRLDSKQYSLKVGSIAETYVGNYVYMPIDELNTMIGFPAGSYMGLWSTEKLDIPENELLAAVTVEDMRKAFDAMTKPLQASIGVISLLSFLIGLLVIYVVASLIIEENKGTISLMKVLGYHKKEIYSLILNSSTFTVIVGYVLGVPLLLASLRAMFESLTKEMNLSFPITIEFGYIIAGFAVIYLTYELSKLLSRKKVNRISMAEALKVEIQ